jgi:hypothetical protein
MTCADFFTVVGSIIWGIQWLNVLLIVVVLYAGFLLYRIHTTPANDFSLIDLLLNEQKKADPRKLMVLVFGALSVWTIVTFVNHDKDAPVTTLLPIMLGIFVGAKVATDIWGKNPPPDDGAK